jgi:hypothetical protein
MTLELLPALAEAAKEQGLLKEVYGDLAKPGVIQVGKALSTVIGLGNTILWPIQLLNERARIALDANLERYRQKLAEVPQEKIAPVPPEVGVPIAEKLSYVQDVDLKELYVNLLAKGSVLETQSQAHPSFVNVINNLSPDEAALLKQFKTVQAQPFVSARLTNPATNHWIEVVEMSFPIQPEIHLAYPQNLVAYISNFEGLGLVRVRRDEYVVPDSVYLPIEEAVRAPFKDSPPMPEFPVFKCYRGRINVTPFGQLFFSACVE